MSGLFEELFPVPELYPALEWLGKQPRWVRMHTRETALAAGLPGADRIPEDDLPRTYTDLDFPVLERAADCPAKQVATSLLRKMYRRREYMVILNIETFSRMLAEGPKVFRPTEEQFESMEQVSIDIPIGQFRSPYNVIAVTIPPETRKRLMREYNIPPDEMPRAAVIRTHCHPGEPIGVLICIRFGKNENHHIFQDQPGNPTVEHAIVRMISNDQVIPPGSSDAQHRLSAVIARASLNLLLMLTHYGHRNAGPVNPTAWAKHRARKDLKHFACRDFEAVEMRQNIVIRRTAEPSGLNPPGPGTGIELAPHWRRGHWRAYPGQARLRAEGQTPQMLFVRPCLVRPDRVQGDVGQSEVVYHGA